MKTKFRQSYCSQKSRLWMLIFTGPIFLHGNSDFSSYHSFFAHLSTKLCGTPSPPIFGTAFAKKISHCLWHPFWPKRCDERWRPGEIRLRLTEDIYTATAPSFHRYFNDRLVLLLQTNFNTASTASNMPSLVKWTNNNCESTNVILKHAMHWKSLPLPALVLKLYDVVRGQYDEIRCALVGQGDYVLCPRFKRFTVPIDTWASLSLEKKYTQYRRFLRHTAIANSKTVTLTDGKLMLTRPTNGGK